MRRPAAAIPFILLVVFLVACSGDSTSAAARGEARGTTVAFEDQAERPAKPSAGDEDEETDEILEHIDQAWTGDLDGMVERGFVRILTVHNPLFFTFDGRESRGIMVDIGRAFENHLNEKVGRVRAPTVLLIPVARDQLLTGLVEGRGDMVAANLTMTPERRKIVAFSDPVYPDIRELVVTGPAAPQISSLDDLVKTELHLRESSSYFEHVSALNAERVRQGKPPIPVRPADEYLEDHDLLDLVNVGVLPAIVVDSHKLAFWAGVFPEVRVHEDLVVHSGGQIAWAVRKESPQLLELVNGFVKTARKGTLLGNMTLNRYTGSADWIDAAVAGEHRARFSQTAAWFQEYAGRYGFDWLMVAAQAYQESRFDQSKRSPAGAVGMMQLLPGTAADPNVGIPDISSVQDNIHAGVKYLAFLRDRYFDDEAIGPLDRILLTFAAYNAGPGNVARARRKATALGFDPNRWFGNVEVGMYRSVSGEPVSYVRNIYKYYVAFKRLDEARQAREKALERQTAD